MQDGAPDAGLDVLLGDAWLGAAKCAGEDLFECLVRRLDGEVEELDAQRLGDEAGVLEALRGRVSRRHAHADDVLGAERIGGDRRGERRVDAARQPDHHLLEALLVDVVVRAEDDGGVDLGGAFERLVLRRPDGGFACPSDAFGSATSVTSSSSRSAPSASRRMLSCGR